MKLSLQLDEPIQNVFDLTPPGLTFRSFSHMNMKRHLEWPRNGNGKKPVQFEWSLSDWTVAVAEETGELCGAIKRLNRLKAGHVMNREASKIASEVEGILKAKKEIGDIVTYLDLLAQELGSSLEECTRLAYNGVSQRENLPHRI